MGRMLVLHVYSADNLAALLRQFPDGTVVNAVPGKAGEDHWVFRADPVIDRAENGMVNPSNQRHLEDMVTGIIGNMMASAAARVDHLAQVATHAVTLAVTERMSPSILVGPREAFVPGLRTRTAEDRRIKDAVEHARRNADERDAKRTAPEPVQHLTIEHEGRRLVAGTDRFEEHYRVYLNCDHSGQVAVSVPLPHQRARDYADGFVRGYDPVGKLHIFDHQAVPFGGVPKVVLPVGHPDRDDMEWADPNSPAAMAIRASMGLPVVMPDTGELGAR